MKKIPRNDTGAAGSYLFKPFTRYINKNQVKTIIEAGSRDLLDAIALRNFYPESTVYSFECNPEGIETCTHNLQGEHNIIFTPKGLSDKNGPKTFYSFASEKTTHHNHGVSSFFQHKDLSDVPSTAITVECTTIDTFCEDNNISQIDMLCLDMQGGEYDALLGAKNILNTVKYIILENDNHCYQNTPVFEEVHDLLSRYSFKRIEQLNGDYLYINSKLIQQRLILDVWGGLGDNLQVSTIPRLFFEKFGYKGVLISNSVKWRNSEIKQLVWDCNPYIAGFTEERGTNISDRGLVKFDGVTNWIQNIEQIYGFKSNNTRPEIYHEIESIDLFNVGNCIVIDMSYSKESYERNLKMFPDMIESAKTKLTELLAQNTGLEIKVIYQPDTLNNVNFFDYIKEGLVVEKIQIESLADYCNIIKHCKQYICSHSGNHALAASIRKTCICFIQAKYFHMKYFVFNDIKYILI